LWTAISRPCHKRRENSEEMRQQRRDGERDERFPDTLALLIDDFMPYTLETIPTPSMGDAWI
jgi:hypothetical protein